MHHERPNRRGFFGALAAVLAMPVLLRQKKAPAATPTDDVERPRCIAINTSGTAYYTTPPTVTFSGDGGGSITITRLKY